jgi:hypothetical protein
MQDYVQPLSPSLANIIPRPGYYPLPQASPYYKNPFTPLTYPLHPNIIATGPLGSSPSEILPSSNDLYLQDFFGYWLSPRDRGPDPDPIHEFMEGKKRFLSRGIEDVLGLIHERVKIKYDLMHQIDYDSCKMKTHLFPLYHFQVGLNPNVDRMRSNIDKELVGLEREKRMEEVACWRDISRLRGELREIMAEYSQEKRKDGLLGDTK